MDKGNHFMKFNGDRKSHLYCFPFGYPIRYCNWTIPNADFDRKEDEASCVWCRIKIQKEQPLITIG